MKFTAHQNLLLEQLRRGYRVERAPSNIAATAFRYVLVGPDGRDEPSLAPRGSTVQALIRLDILALGPMPARVGARRKLEFRDPDAAPVADASPYTVKVTSPRNREPRFYGTFATSDEASAAIGRMLASAGTQLDPGTRLDVDTVPDGVTPKQMAAKFLSG
jgi:hypothetical protein